MNAFSTSERRRLMFDVFAGRPLKPAAIVASVLSGEAPLEVA